MNRSQKEIHEERRVLEIRIRALLDRVMKPDYPTNTDLEVSGDLKEAQKRWGELLKEEQELELEQGGEDRK